MNVLLVSIAVVLACAWVGAFVYHRFSGRHFFRDGIDKLRMSTHSLSAWDAHWRKKPERSDIVVCLTTLPSRLPHLDATLKSLLYQTRAPAKIRLHVPRWSIREDVAYAIPDWLGALESVEVVVCDRDWGPATKLIPALLDCEPQQRLLVVDDDKLYPPTLVSDFDRWSTDRPDVVIASSGWSVPEDLTDRTVTVWSNFKGVPPARRKATLVTSPTPIDIVQGHSGYLVRPSDFDLESLIEGYADAPEEAFFVDDVWISGHCRVEKWIMPARRFCFVSWQHVGLFDRTSLGTRDADTDRERHPNTVMIRYLRDQWRGFTDSAPISR